jgi:hypothetical protein
VHLSNDAPGNDAISSFGSKPRETMISYFDRANCAIFGIAQQTCGDDELFLSQAVEVEDRIVSEVCLNTGDIEFPDDLRQKILTVIACKRINGVLKDAETEGRRIARIMRYSPLIGQLHSAFSRASGQRHPGAVRRVDRPPGFESRAARRL